MDEVMNVASEIMNVASKEIVLNPELETDLRLVAFDPTQLQRSQQQLIGWAERKVESMLRQVRDSRANLRIAKESKWNTSRLKAALTLVEGRLLFYKKIRDALMAGYYIVPDFPCDVFAIRTQRKLPLGIVASSDSPYQYGVVPNERAQLLPTKDGEYKNPRQIVQRFKYSSKDQATGLESTTYNYVATDFLAMDFPFALAKPQILDATQRAMALKIFDEIGVAPTGTIQSRKKVDPMVLGTISQPKRGCSQKKVTFLIAWFLDTESL